MDDVGARPENVDHAEHRAVAEPNTILLDPVLLDNTAQSRLREVLASNQALQTVHEFRERLRQMWSGANMSNEKLVQHLKDWIAQAEESRIKVLQDFAATLRGYAMQPA